MNDTTLNFQRFGCYHTACGRILPGRHTAALDDPAMDHPPAPIEPVRHVIEGARSFASERGLSDPHADIDYHAVRANRDLLKDLAHHYDRLPANDPGAHKHFAAMRDEVDQQFHHLTHNMGVKMQVTDRDPYHNVHELRDDVANNRRIKVLGTHATGGHPFFTDEQNDRFRAVHDVFGHLGTGRDFDRHGEEAAFQAHARMFSEHARPALTSETRGQNGSLIVNGRFSGQKIAVLPKRLWHPGLASTAELHNHGGRNRARDLKVNRLQPEHFVMDQIGKESSVQRVAVLHGFARRSDEDAETFTRRTASSGPKITVVAHVSGNSIDVYHCAFCGSGALCARSDGTIECTFCTAVFTVQVQPQFAAFPQTAEGTPYQWPGQPGAEQLAGGGSGAMGGFPGPVAGEEDPEAEGGDGNPFTDDADESGAGPDDGSDGPDDDGGKAQVGGKDAPPFDKKKSSSLYQTAAGHLLDETRYLQHLAISHAHNRGVVARAIRASQ